MSNAEKKRAPKASEALRAAREDMRPLPIYELAGVWDQHIAAAERAEAEAEERDGESVEALMRECAGLLVGAPLAVYLDDEGIWYANAESIKTTCFAPRMERALTALRDKLRAASSPSAPDYEKMGWEELETLLPEEATIMYGTLENNQGAYRVSTWGHAPPPHDGQWAPTRIAAVRAYLREHGGGAA